MNFIIVGLQPWDIEIGSNCKNIALELSKNHTVLYVNAPLSRKQTCLERTVPRVKKRLEYLKSGEVVFEKINENLTVYYPDCIVEIANSLRPHFLFKAINKINNKRFAKSIQKAVSKLELDEYVLFNDNSIYLGYYLKELLKPKSYIYYIRDNLTSMKFWKYHGSRLEPSLIAKADLIVTNSNYYETYAREFNENSHMIGQGCDFEFLDKIQNKNDFPKLKSPIIGYIGFLTTLRLSIDLIHEIAQKQPKWNIVLIGPEDENFKNSKLHKCENIHFLGSKNVENLSYYLNEFDVCINPQIVNEITIGNYPRKIDEYLYMGKPCVATNTTAMDYFKDYVSLANSSEEYIDEIQKAIENDTSENQVARKEFAKTHTWQQSVNEMEKHIQTIPN